MKAERYNIRVYGLLIDADARILVTDERRGGFRMTKFPGGGHELGEGLADGLRREWQEELGLEIEIGKLFYINDFLQLSQFNPRDQLLSVYYEVSAGDLRGIPSTQLRFDFPKGEADAQTFRWLALDGLAQDEFTFPVDRVVVERLGKWRKQQNSR